MATGPQLDYSCQRALVGVSGMETLPREEAGWPSATQDGIAVLHRLAKECKGKDDFFWAVDLTFRHDISWTAS